MDLRYFLTIGMISSGMLTIAFGLGYFWNIHSFAYFVTVQVHVLIICILLGVMARNLIQPVCWLNPLVDTKPATYLRTVPTTVIAHMFCVSQDIGVSCWWSLYKGIFVQFKNYAEKAELSKCSWYPKRKLHFSEIIKLQI